MSGEALTWARKKARPSGGLPANAVLLLMADYAGRKHDLDPSVETMAEELGCTSRTVQRAVASLLADGLIEREFRVTEKGKTTSSRYVLRLDRTGPGCEGGSGEEGCQTVTPRGDTQSPSGVTDSHHEGDTQSPSTTLEPRTLTSGSSDELPDVCVGADADANEVGVRQAFDALEAVWVAHPKSPGRSDQPRSWAAFQAAVADGTDAQTLLGAGRRWLAESRDSKAGHVMLLASWLTGKRWRGFEPKAADPSKPPAPTFPGPADFAAAVRSAKGEAWVASWLDPCGWDADLNAVLARGSFSRDRVAAELRGLLTKFRITVIVRKAAP